MVMGWQNTHLYAFEIGGKSYSDKESAEEMRNTLVADGTMLSDVLENKKKFIMSMRLAVSLSLFLRLI